MHNETTIISAFWGFVGLSGFGAGPRHNGRFRHNLRNRVLFLPTVGSSPETGFLFGGVVVPQFKVSDAGLDTRSSSILISAIYTVKNQVLTSVVPDIILPCEEWLLRGTYFANYFPENYWGVGPFTNDDDELLVLYTQINLEQAALRKIKSGLFSGPYLRWSKTFNMKYENTDGNRIPSPDVRGSDGSLSAGFGWMTRLDRRNSNMTPTKNHFVEFSLLGYSSWLGSTDPFTSYHVDARKCFDLSGDTHSVLALQGLVRITTGRPPFRDMSMLGGYHQSRVLPRPLS